ncbi:hypothetical protein G7085_16145 [Tessaracoccus sp. HDW20]|uniref:hypothetical protein n=1 Tax=Tessaracoccus coleopterorum TaxID=2714950 RepID=UPI0018D3EFA8|nr:hypothetical protein [Tessaracoccus coleopterorum]NHB85612.1 hypothetical protein [Tessaracoccus coleopterorum]
MEDGEAKRPRRAWTSDEPETDGFDDTPAGAAQSARRGSPDEPEPGLGDEPTSGAAANPFARPGSDSASGPAPSGARGVAPDASTPIPAPVFPRSSAIPSPAPRRSALSGTTPAEADHAPDGSWLEAHRPRLTAWAVGGLAAALVLGLSSFFIARGVREGGPGPSPSVSTSATPSASASPIAEPVTTDDLVTPQDLSPIAAASGWSEVATTEAVADHKSFAFCLSSLKGEVNPTHSLQRTLSTATDDKLAALHRIDAYADETAAGSVMEERIAALSDCSAQLVPARIVGASSVTGLATRAFEINLASDDVAGDFHTLLLTQEGATLQLLDVRRVGEPVTADALAAALTRPQKAINEAQGTTAEVARWSRPRWFPPLSPRLADRLRPARIREGAGLWSASAQSALGTFGTGCENMTLASEAGPTERQVTRFQLTQDDQAPRCSASTRPCSRSPPLRMRRRSSTSWAATSPAASPGSSAPRSPSFPASHPPAPTACGILPHLRHQPRAVVVDEERLAGHRQHRGHPRLLLAGDRRRHVQVHRCRAHRAGRPDRRPAHPGP